MKLVLLVALACIALSSIDAKSMLNGKRAGFELKDIIAKTVAHGIVRKMVQDNAKAPVLPELEDPFPIENAELDLGSLDVEGLSGLIALRDGEATGTSFIVDDLAIAITIPARITYKLNARTLRAVGQYEVTDVNLEGLHFHGAGRLDAEIVNPFGQAIVRVTINLITNRFVVNSVDLDVAFDDVKGEAEGLLFNGEPVDWEAVNEDAQAYWDDFWATNEGEIEASVKALLVELLKDCKITDLIAGNFDCIALPPPESKTSRVQLFNQMIQHFVRK